MSATHVTTKLNENRIRRAQTKPVSDPTTRLRVRACGGMHCITTQGAEARVKKEEQRQLQLGLFALGVQEVSHCRAWGDRKSLNCRSYVCICIYIYVYIFFFVYCFSAPPAGCVYLSVCLSVRPSVCLSVFCLGECMYVCMHVCMNE